MKFSVIVPYYRSIITIAGTLESLLRQTNKDFEVILVDDCSDDQIMDIVYKYKRAFDIQGISLLFVRLNVNAGPSKARNVAWDLANGEYVAFLDSDDIWHPEKLQICAHFLDVFDISFLIHDSEVFNSNSDLEGGLEFNAFSLKCVSKYNLIFRNIAVTPAVILKSNIKSRFDESMIYCEDHDLWLRLAFSLGKVYRIVGNPLTFLGKPFMVGNGLSSNFNKMRIGELRMYLKFIKARPLLYVALPLFMFYSILKHLNLLFKRMIKPIMNLVV